MKDIKDDCYDAYTKGGLTAVFDLVDEKYPNLVVWTECYQCETQTPHFTDECLVCGTGLN